MARFRGTLAGNRGDCSRLGTTKSGLAVTANGWYIGADVRMYEGANGEDRVSIRLTAGSTGDAISREIGDYTRADLDAMNADACTLPGCNGYRAPDSPRNHPPEADTESYTPGF